MDNLKFIDITKGVSILLIIAFHALGQVFHMNSGLPRFYTYQGVLFFFAMSGFALTYSLLAADRDSIHWKTWFVKRFRRVYPIYLFVLCITFVSFYLGLGLKVVPIPIVEHYYLDFIVHALMLHVYHTQTYFSINVAWWFVGVIVQFYIVFPLLFNISYKTRTSFRLVAGYILMVMIILALKKGLVSIGLTGDLLGRYYNQVLTGFFFFCLGIVLAFIFMNNTRRNYPIIPVILASAAILMVLYGFSFVKAFASLKDVSIILLDFIMVLVLSVLLSTYGKKFIALDLFSSLLERTGNISYALYLIHWSLIVPIISRFDNLYLGFTVYALITLLLSYCLTIVDYRYLRKPIRIKEPSPRFSQ